MSRAVLVELGAVAHAPIARSYATLIERSLDEHAALVALAGAEALIRKDGWYDAFRTGPALAAAVADAEARGRDFGVRFDVLDGDGVARLEPHLTERMAGAVHWSDTWTVREPAALVAAYADAFVAAGGTLVQGEAAVPRAAGAGWRVMAGARPIEAAEVVIATGPWAAGMTRALGYRLPLFVKRGYHMHYAGEPGRPLGNWLADLETGYLLAPMRKGIRLTTGAELALQDAPATPRQLALDEAVARRMFPLGARLDPAPWMGSRPCTADMLPVIGPAPRHRGLWFAFGHGHQGLTLGPVTGRLLAEMITGEAPVVNPRPFFATRFV
ncbi:MAG: FAD-binding oxidoreductase [Amaricoccus sp.]|uniref:NAD(P)/FAD-dependent oxidoreductase n=1 Tax=Amaricoccus sp. TaxID=1872485 RepID=UPI0039E6B10D